MKKRTIFIGLGGTGGQVLLAWRRALAASGMPPVGDDMACLYLDAVDDVVQSPEWQELAADIPFLNIKTEARSLNEMEQNPELKSCVAGMRWQVADALKSVAKPNDVILVKGSRGMRMELVLEEFLRQED